MPDETRPTPGIDLQDPLPESNWLWRRVFVFAAVTTTFVILYLVIQQLGLIAYMEPRRGIEALLDLAMRLLWLLFALIVFYMLAPSAEQMVKMIQTAGLLRNNVQIASRSVQEPDGRTEIAQTAGKPPQPVAPPIVTGPPATVPTQGGSDKKPLWDE